MSSPAWPNATLRIHLTGPAMGLAPQYVSAAAQMMGFITTKTLQGAYGKRCGAEVDEKD